MPKGSSSSTSGSRVTECRKSGQNKGSKWSPVVGSGDISGQRVLVSVESATSSGIRGILVIIVNKGLIVMLF